MSNSPMVCYTRISPNSSARTQKIRKITPHHMAGNLSVETCGSVFAPSSRQASSNYGIGTDGRVGMYVEESRRAWTSSSAANDQQAVTIEVANDEIGGNWHVSDKAFETLVDLCVDICQRNGIPSLTYTGDSSGTLTCHDMFANTNCPGPYLKSKLPELASRVNARLSGGGGSAGGSTSGSTGGGTSSGGTSSGSFGGTYRVNCSALNVRSAPSLSGSVVASYSRGQTVILDDWYKIADGYVWGKYTAYSGNVRYIAVGKATGKPEADDYLIKV